MGRFARLFALLFVCLLAAPAAVFASQIDGMTLRVRRGPAPGAVTLDWTGGQPTFRVYRAATPQSVVAPPNLVGTTDVRTFDDAPPSGQIFFYEIASPCVYAPPEVCNGVDDDCNGTVDGPGSEASCSLAHAVPTCTAGACAVAGCDFGWGDCNTGNADGCEAPLALPQSTSPAAIWANDPNPNKDLKPQYARVLGITNCGACGVTCNDGIACTTDLCVPTAAGGACRHYDRGQCAEARCGGVQLPPGTPPPRDPACTAVDSDGDGLSDPWETAQTNPYTAIANPRGIDLDCDGEISDPDDDFVYSDPPVGPAVKDIYLKIAYMGPSTVPGEEETESHAPLPASLDAVTAAFANHGITLHIDGAMAEVPHADVVFMPVSGPDSCATGDAVNLYDIKNATFDPRLKFTHKYMLFSHKHCYAHEAEAQTSGLAEFKGNDVIVSLGLFPYVGSPAVVVEKKTRESAGTFMHELGHTLGLDHGGPSGDCDLIPCGSAPFPQKPNYISVMSYSYQLPGIPRAATPGTVVPLDPTAPWRVDFSPTPYGALNESNLDEITGLIGATPPYDRDIVRYYCVGQGPYLAPGHGSVDWNCDSVYSPSTAADIDFDGTLAILTGAGDWGNLEYKFQCNPTFLDSADHPAYVTPRELSLAQATARGLRATILCQSNADCDDGAFCNGVETCSLATGLCQAGTPPVCNDSNACTIDSCNVASNACAYDPVGANGNSCTGSQFCVVGQVCANGVCGGGTPRNCEDGLPCTANACDEALDACTSSCTAAPCWTASVGSGVAKVPASSPTRSYVIKGPTLYAFGPTGSVDWTWATPTGTTLENFPNPVELSPGAGGGVFLYVGAGDGRLYKVRAQDGVATATTDLRRASCPQDKVAATPAIQLYRFSNPTFQNEMDSHAGHAGDDIVIVVTNDQCGDTTRNRILAYYASNLELKMAFNDPATHKVDFGSDGCSIDYPTNRLFCGTSQPAGGTQNTLWAVDSIDAHVVWSANAGPLVARPMLAGGRVYVAAVDGTVMAYDPAGDGAGGALRLWTSPAVAPGSITRNPWVEFRPGGYAGTILVVDGLGNLTRFTDTGDHATKNWTVRPGPGLTFTSMAAVDPGHGTAYIGRSDGFVQQVNLGTGAVGVQIPVQPPESVFDPSLDFDRLTVAAGNLAGTVAQFCTWPPPPGGCTTNAECAAQSGPCQPSVCDQSLHACVRVAAPNGTSCDDTLSCTATSACMDGACQSDSYTSCQCIGPGDMACGAGLTCCGSAQGCTNLQTDSGNCGACGNVCPVDRTCSAGRCVAAPAACAAPTKATLDGAASVLSGADAIAFDRLDVATGVCSAYLSSYRYPSTSTIQRVNAFGSVTTMNSPSPDSAPLNGVAVPREGNQVFATAVNRTLGAIPNTVPGLIEGGFSPPHLTVARTTVATYSSAPFTVANFDQGPVGPSLDYQTYTSSAGSDSRLYYGNWAANGDVVELRRICSGCPWTATPVPVTIAPAGQRITAIAFEQHKVPGPLQYHRTLYIGHGAVLTIVDLDLATQTDVSLAAAQPPQVVSSILSIAVHPVYADIFVEVATSSGNRFVLDVDAHDQSMRHEREVQIDMHIQPVMPLAFTEDGRIAIMPDGQLLRFVPGASVLVAPKFEKYEVVK